MGWICVLVHVLAVTGSDGWEFTFPLTFWSGFWACECKLRRKLQCAKEFLSSPVVFLTQTLLLNSATTSVADGQLIRPVQNSNLRGEEKL